MWNGSFSYYIYWFVVWVMTVDKKAWLSLSICHRAGQISTQFPLLKAHISLSSPPLIVNRASNHNKAFPERITTTTDGDNPSDGNFTTAFRDKVLSNYCAIRTWSCAQSVLWLQTPHYWLWLRLLQMLPGGSFPTVPPLLSTRYWLVFEAQTLAGKCTTEWNKHICTGVTLLWRYIYPYFACWNDEWSSNIYYAVESPRIGPPPTIRSSTGRTGCHVTVR